MKRLAYPLLIVAVVLVQFRAVLAGGIYHFEDIAGYFEPLWTAAARQMAAGRWPIWDGGAWSGQPLIGDPQLGLFYPPNWLWLVLPPLRAYAVLVVVHALWAVAGMYHFARLRGRSPAAAALGAIGLGVGGYLVLQVRHIMFVEATAWIPWVLTTGWQALGDDRRRSYAWFSLASGALLLTGGVSMIYYGAWFIGALLIVRTLSLDEPWRRLGKLATFALLGLCVAAPMLVPAWTHGQLSPRALGADPAFASEGSWPHLGFLATLLVPNPFGDDAMGSWRGGYTQWELAAYYSGVATALLGLGWIFLGERTARRERWTLAALLALAVGVAWQGSVVQRAAYHALPLFSSMRCPARALYVASLALPLAASEGLDALLTRLPPARRAIVGSLVVVLLALDLLVAHRHENRTTTLAEAERASTGAAVGFLRDHPGDRYVNDVRLDHALHNSGLLWGLENASGYSSLPIWRYLHYLWIANHGAPYPHRRIRGDLAAQGLWRFSSPLVDALNVRWVLASEPPNGPGFARRLAGRGLDVWENLEALPRHWVVHRVRRVADEAAAARAIAEPSFDPRREAILEGAGPPVEEAANVLVVSQPCYPGWRAIVDGQPAKLECADLALTAITLSPGEHRVELRLASRPIQIGLALAAFGLVVLLGLARGRRDQAVAVSPWPPPTR